MSRDKVAKDFSEEELVADVQAGDSAALSELYRRYITPIFRYVRKRVATTETAEDVTSEIFLGVVRQIGSFRSESTFRTWIYGIARRRIADHWRRAYQLPEAAIETVDLIMVSSESSEEEDDLHDAMAERERLIAVLATLPEKYKRVLECRFLEGKTIRETASTLSLTESNVKVIQHRAIAMAATPAKANSSTVQLESPEKS